MSDQPAPDSTNSVFEPVQSPTPPADAPDLSNLYIFGDSERDRDRLAAQSFLLSAFIRQKAPYLIRNDVRAILDMGCGEGQLTLVLAKLYPKARIIAVDIDPGAVERAKENQRRASPGLAKIEFIGGDIREKLPAGPFDLIFASLVMVHLPDPQPVMRAAFEALAPNGSLWVKDGHGLIELNHPSFNKFLGLVLEAMRKINLDPLMGLRLEEMMRNAGFIDVKTSLETYRINSESWQGRIVLSDVYGILYNSRKMVTKILGVPEEELMAMDKDLRDSAATLKGSWTIGNIVGHRPADAPSVTTTQTAAVAPLADKPTPVVPDPVPSSSQAKETQAPSSS